MSSYSYELNLLAGMRMRYLLALAIFSMLSNNAFSKSEYYCTYYGGIKKSANYGEGFNGQKCREGDALRIISYDHADLGRESMYLSSEITELCDLHLPVTVIGPIAKGNTESGSMHAVCTYHGGKRKIRK